MKKTLLIPVFFLLFLSGNVYSQIAGYWQGELKSENSSLLLVFSITEKEGKFSSIISIPQQLILENKNSKTSFSNRALKIVFPAFQAELNATLNDGGDQLIGKWYQNGDSLPLVLDRKSEESVFKISRTQTPIAPFPYVEQEVSVLNKKDKISLAGTLTIPDTLGKFPLVILISGSGPQDRNEELVKHKPFFVLADYLTRMGIGVYRYDDRGVGKSQGKFAAATTDDFANDAENVISALAKHKNINPEQIGVLGHSEGGIIAFMLANRMRNLKFAIALAGVSIPCDQLLILQQAKIMLGHKIPEDIVDAYTTMNTRIFEMVKTEENVDSAQKKAILVFDEVMGQFDESTLKKYSFNYSLVKSIVAQTYDTWFRYFLKIIPSDYLSNLKTNVLALFGSKDVQVPAVENEEFFKQYAKTSKGNIVESKTFVGMNHLFQKSKTGLPDEYAMIEETINPEVLEYIGRWIKDIIKRP